MSGLARPYAGAHLITQPFLGTYYNPATGIGENPGYTEPDGLSGLRTARVGWRYWRHVHLAQDVAMPVGTDLLAPCKSRLVVAGTYASTGEHYAMLLFHRDAVYQTLVFLTHLEAGGILVPVGTLLSPLQHFAESGKSGMVTGAHLHWEVRRGPALADPHLSGTWLKIDPAACLVGGSLVNVSWMQPNL